MGEDMNLSVDEIETLILVQAYVNSHGYYERCVRRVKQAEDERDAALAELEKQKTKIARLRQRRGLY